MLNTQFFLLDWSVNIANMGPVRSNKYLITGRSIINVSDVDAENSLFPAIASGGLSLWRWWTHLKPCWTSRPASGRSRELWQLCNCRWVRRAGRSGACSGDTTAGQPRCCRWLQPRASSGNSRRRRPAPGRGEPAGPRSRCSPAYHAHSRLLERSGPGDNVMIGLRAE